MSWNMFNQGCEESYNEKYKTLNKVIKDTRKVDILAHGLIQLIFSNCPYDQKQFTDITRSQSKHLCHSSHI